MMKELAILRYDFKPRGPKGTLSDDSLGSHGKKTGKKKVDAKRLYKCYSKF